MHPVTSVYIIYHPSTLARMVIKTKSGDKSIMLWGANMDRVGCTYVLIIICNQLYSFTICYNQLGVSHWGTFIHSTFTIYAEGTFQVLRRRRPGPGSQLELFEPWGHEWVYF